MKKIFSLFAVTIFAISSLTNVVYARSNVNEHRNKSVAYENRSHSLGYEGKHFSDTANGTHMYDDTYHTRLDGYENMHRGNSFGTKSFGRCY